jgi:hypothetical protein
MSLPKWSEVTSSQRFTGLSQDDKVKVYDAWESRASKQLSATPEGALQALQIKAFGGRVRSGLMGEQLEPAKANDVFQSYLQDFSSRIGESQARVDEVAGWRGKQDELIALANTVREHANRLSPEDQARVEPLIERLKAHGVDPDDTGVVDRVFKAIGDASVVCV